MACKTAEAYLALTWKLGYAPSNSTEQIAALEMLNHRTDAEARLRALVQANEKRLRKVEEARTEIALLEADVARMKDEEADWVALMKSCKGK